MALYRKKPVVIEAVRCSTLITQAMHDWSQLPQWFRDAHDQGGVVIMPDQISLPTKEGTMIAGRTDMVICGVAGEVYPCKAEIFAATYEAVEEGSL